MKVFNIACTRLCRVYKSAEIIRVAYVCIVPIPAPCRRKAHRTPMHNAPCRIVEKMDSEDINDTSTDDSV